MNFDGFKIGIQQILRRFFNEFRQYQLIGFSRFRKKISLEDTQISIELCSGFQFNFETEIARNLKPGKFQLFLPCR